MTKKVFSLLIIFSTIVVLLYAVIAPRNPDTYLYHIGAIQWNEFYIVIPGLANFHNRLGLNSSIFVLSAGFSFSTIYNQYLFIINSLSFYVFFIWILKKIYFQKGFIALFSIIFIYFFIRQYAEFMSSPGSDLLPNLFVGYLLLNLMFFEKSPWNKSLIYIAMPLFCITLKLNTLPIVFVTMFAIYKNSKNFIDSFIKFISYSLLFIMPWMIRNVFLTGYLIYPSLVVDVFNFDWKVPADKVTDIQSWIYSFGRIPFKHYNEVLNLPFKQWITVWFGAALPTDRYLYILALLSPLFFGVSVLINKKKEKDNNLLVLFVAFLSCLIWIFTAPDIRFSASFIIILALFPLFLIKNIVIKIKKITNLILFIGLSFVLFDFSEKGYMFFEEDYNVEKTSNYAYLPIDVSEIKEKRLVPYNEFNLTTKEGKIIKVFSSVGESATYDKFPCTVNFANDCGLRGETLQEGFYSKY